MSGSLQYDFILSDLKVILLGFESTLISIPNKKGAP
jgi:hypothetical protein